MTHVLVAVNGAVAEVQCREWEALPPHDAAPASHCAVVGPVPSPSPAGLA